MKTAIKALMLLISMSAPLVAMESSKDESQELLGTAQETKNAVKDEATEWGFGYYWQAFRKRAGGLCTSGLKAASQEITSLQKRYQEKDLKWNDTDMLILEGALGVVLYLGYKKYKGPAPKKRYYARGW